MIDAGSLVLNHIANDDEADLAKWILKHCTSQRAITDPYIKPNGMKVWREAYTFADTDVVVVAELRAGDERHGFTVGDYFKIIRVDNVQES